jgi:hypothetical protein
LFGYFSFNKGDTDIVGTRGRALATVLSGPGKKGRIEVFNTEASSKDALRRNKGRQSVRNVDVISKNFNTRTQ